MPTPSTAEHRRLEEVRATGRKWRRWGTYLPERQWGTVREDYSADGEAWDYFPFDHAHQRAYRWGDDGLLGLCDNRGLVCFGIALWNGVDARPEGAPLRPERQGGQPRRGREGALLVRGGRRRPGATRGRSTSTRSAPSRTTSSARDRARRAGTTRSRSSSGRGSSTTTATSTSASSTRRRTRTISSCASR